MNCIEHHQIAAVATCQGCQCGLCPQCFGAYRGSYCHQCAAQSRALTRHHYLGRLVLILSVFVGVTLWSLLRIEAPGPDAHHVASSVLQGWGAAGVISGWYALNKVTPAYFLFLPLIGWLIYFVLKLFLAAVIGIVAFPYYVFICIRSIILVREA